MFGSIKRAFAVAKELESAMSLITEDQEQLLTFGVNDYEQGRRRETRAILGTS